MIMNWKKIGKVALFISLILVFVIVLLFFRFFFIMPFLLSFIFIIFYALLLYFVIFQFTWRRMIYLLLLILLYLLVFFVPWPACEMGIGKYESEGFIEGGAFEKEQKCDCLGFEIRRVPDYSGNPIYSRCFGVPLNITVHQNDNLVPTLSSENPFEIVDEVIIHKRKRAINTDEVTTESKISVYIYNRLENQINIQLKLTKCIDTDGLDVLPINFVTSPPQTIEPGEQQGFKVLFKPITKGQYICTIVAFDTNTDTLYGQKQFFLTVK